MEVLHNFLQKCSLVVLVVIVTLHHCACVSVLSFSFLLLASSQGEREAVLLGNDSVPRLDDAWRSQHARTTWVLQHQPITRTRLSPSSTNADILTLGRTKGWTQAAFSKGFPLYVPFPKIPTQTVNFQ